MLQVTIIRDTSARITSYLVKGHTGYAEHGKDIVCAAVSVLAQTAIIGLEEYLKVEVDRSVTSGDLEVRLPEGLAQLDLDDDVSVASQAILETMALGFKAIARDYEGYLRVLDQKSP